MSAVAYFVKNAQLDLFRQRGILSLEDTVGNSRGIIFLAEFKERALEALGWNDGEIKEIPTSEWSVNELVVNNGEDSPRVGIKFHSEPSNHWRQYLDIAAGFCSNLNLSLPVVLHYSHDEHGLYENGALHVCFGGQAGYRVKADIHERDVFYQRSHMWVGELGPEHDHCRNLIPVILGNFLPRITGEINEINTEFFADDCAKWLEKRNKDLESQLKSIRDNIESYQNCLISSIRKEQTIQQDLDRRKKTLDEELESLKVNIEDIKRRPYVRHVKYDQGMIFVFTERIAVNLNEYVYDIGEFLIAIGTGGSYIKIYNQTKQISSFLVGRVTNHPHIDQAGNPCLGTIKEIIPRYIARREFAALLDILYNYLKSVDPDDTWGKSIAYWPRFN